MHETSSTTGPSRIIVRDQYGFSLGGPIRKNKTFFFVDFEKIRQQDPINLEGVVPTDLERAGDFSQSPANLADPSNPDRHKPASMIRALGTRNLPRRAHTAIRDGGVLNKIPADKIDPIGQAILNLYPHANIDGAVYPDPNWRKVIIGYRSRLAVRRQGGSPVQRPSTESAGVTAVTTTNLPRPRSSAVGSGRWHDLPHERPKRWRGVQLVRHSDCTFHGPLQRGPRVCARR